MPHRRPHMYTPPGIFKVTQVTAGTKCGFPPAMVTCCCTPLTTAARSIRASSQPGANGKRISRIAGHPRAVPSHAVAACLAHQAEPQTTPAMLLACRPISSARSPGLRFPAKDGIGSRILSTCAMIAWAASALPSPAAQSPVLSVAARGTKGSAKRGIVVGQV